MTIDMAADLVLGKTPRMSEDELMKILIDEATRAYEGAMTFTGIKNAITFEYCSKDILLVVARTNDSTTACKLSKSSQ